MQDILVREKMTTSSSLFPRVAALTVSLPFLPDLTAPPSTFLAPPSASPAIVPQTGHASCSSHARAAPARVPCLRLLGAAVEPSASSTAAPPHSPPTSPRSTQVGPDSLSSVEPRSLRTNQERHTHRNRSTHRVKVLKATLFVVLQFALLLFLFHTIDLHYYFSFVLRFD
jgi:hypothetical protein